jgi:hypothetical protein
MLPWVQGDPYSRPPPIEPAGLLDGLDWLAIILAGALDIVLTIVGSLVLIFWLSPELLTIEDEGLEQAFNQAVQSTEFLFWGLVMGLAVTAYAAYWGARRAGRHPVRHGGWIAIASAVMGTVLLLVPGLNEGPATLLWYDALGYALILPAGLLGGFVASKR